MKRLTFAFAVLFIVSLIPAAASSSTGGASVLRTRGYVKHIAADGLRVAAATNGIARKCDRIVVWNPVQRTISDVKTNVDCFKGDGAINEVPEVAIAGKRVAWMEGVGGNSLELSIRSRMLGAKKTLTIAFAANSNGAEMQPDGDYVGNLVGDGSLLAYNAWHVCSAVPVGGEDDLATCTEPAPGNHEVLDFSKQQLLEVVGKNGVEIASAPDTVNAKRTSLEIVSVDAGRIATQAPGGEVTLYSSEGDVVTQIAVPAGSFAGSALQGSQLVTLRDGDLELYDVSSGELTTTIPLAAGAVLRDLQDDLAVYIVGRKVHVLRLSDGADIVYSPPGKGAVDAQIESPGLFYSYSFPSGLDHGRIAFVRFAKVLQKLG